MKKVTDAVKQFNEMKKGLTPAQQDMFDKIIGARTPALPTEQESSSSSSGPPPVLQNIVRVPLSNKDDEQTAATALIGQNSSQKSEESETNEAPTTPKKAVGSEFVGKYCLLTPIGKEQFTQLLLNNNDYPHNGEWKKHLDATFKVVKVIPANTSSPGDHFTRYVIKSLVTTTPELIEYAVIGSNFQVVPTPTTTTLVSNNGSSSSTTTGDQKITLDAYINESTEDMEHSSCFYVYETAVQLRGQLSPLPKDTAHLLQVKATEEQWDKIFTTVDENVETNQTLTSEYAIYDQVVMNDSEFPKYAIYSIENKSAYLLCLEGEKSGRVLPDPQPFDSLAPAVEVESSAKKTVKKKRSQRERKLLQKRRVEKEVKVLKRKIPAKRERKVQQQLC